MTQLTEAWFEQVILFFSAIPGKLNWRKILAESEFEIIKWDSLQQCGEESCSNPPKAMGFMPGWWQLIFWVCCHQLQEYWYWDAHHFHWNCWQSPPNGSSAVQCTHPKQQSHVAQSPVAQTGHPVGLQCVAGCQCSIPGLVCLDGCS